MQSKIQSILEQAGVKINCYGKPIPVSLAPNFDDVVRLIVQECASIAAINQAENMDWDISEIIKEHFGVK